MKETAWPREVFTPEQAADYLQVNRETIYRYIREGKLVASKLGRAYRIPQASLNMLLWATRIRKDVSLREYTGQQVEEFIQTHQLDREAQEIAKRFSQAIERKRPQQAPRARRSA